MAVNRQPYRSAPLAREWDAAADLAREIRTRGATVSKATLTTLLGGILAIVTILGIVILAALGRPVPGELASLALLAGAWYFATSTASAVRRTGGGDE